MRRATGLFAALMGITLFSTTAFGTATYRDSLYYRMKSLQRSYPNQVSIAFMHNRPAYFLKTTDLGQSQTTQFRKDLLKTLGTNTLRAWNTTDWLQVGTGTGSNPKLSQQNQGKHFALYNHFRDNTWQLPTGQQSCVLVKLKNSQMKNSRGKGFDQYMNAIRSDFSGALGRTDYNGDWNGPPFVTGRANSAHNCTSWFTSWLKQEVGRGFRYGADPGSWCISTARSSSAKGVRGLMVFNHPNTPQNNARLSSNFQLYWGDVH